MIGYIHYSFDNIRGLLDNIHSSIWAVRECYSLWYGNRVWFQSGPMWHLVEEPWRI